MVISSGFTELEKGSFYNKNRRDPCLPLSALHDFWHGRPLSLIVVVVLEFHPGINRVSCLSMLSDVYSPVFGLGLDTEQVEIVERVKDKETPDGSP